MKYESVFCALAAPITVVCTAPLLVSAAVLGNIGYDTTFVADGSFAAIQNLGNGTFSNGERVTGVDIRIAAPLGGIFRPEIRSFLATSDMSTVVEAAYQPSAGGENVFHFDLPTPFVPDPSECYVLMFYQFSSAPNTTFYGWSTDKYSASTAGCHPTYASHNINTALQNPALNGHGLVDYSFQIITESIQSPPEISNLKQYRQFGVDEIAEGATFVGNVAVFKANIQDADSAEVKLEVELKPMNVPFDGTNITPSDLQSLGTVAFEHNELIPTAEHYQSGGNVESFHWRARAVDAEGNTSDWVEFSPDATPDFTAKVVPLWTQKESPFPSNEQTALWAERDFANRAADKVGDCGLTITQCGCAITSALMIAQYHGTQNGADGLPISPLNFNNWLLENSTEFKKDGTFTWHPLEKYTEGNVQYIGDKRFDIPEEPTYQNTSADFALLDEYVNQTVSIPVISKSSATKTHGGIRRLHFFVIDSKVGSRYTMRDPFWFGTKTLDDAASVPGLVRRYEGGFDGLRIYEEGEGLAYTPRMTHTLGSPAELLFADSQGRRLGKDPRTGQTYDEIPGGNYFVDDRISNPDENVPDITPREGNKVIELENPPEGPYTLEVIGTGTGSYSLISTFTDTGGEATSTIFLASTSPNLVSSYQGGYSSTSAESSTIIPSKKETAQDVFNQLKLAVDAAAITPKTLKTTIKASVLAAEKLYKSGKLTLAKLALKGLKELIKNKRGKGIATSDADKLVVLIDKLLLLI